MEIRTRVILLILILISSKVWNGFCISQEEDRIISKRQADLLTVRSAAHMKAMQSIKQPQCLQNEHGPNCTYCVARDTCEEGHFTCDVSTGNKICLPGYQGNNCRISTKLANSFYDVTCPENTCRNGGSCASSHCCCREGFTGILCEIEIIECKSNSCLNGGICKDLIGKFECLCKPTFRGKNCEIPISAPAQTTPSRDSSCQSKSCQNNGTCLEDTFLTYCLCPTFYTGDNCETHIGTSSTVHNTCPENYFGDGCGTFCQPRDDCFGHYVCDQSTGGKICLSGWHGQNCDTRNIPQRIDPECPQHSCKNDGQCFTKGCCCRNNYTGDNCQIESIGCLSSPCKNNATCTNKGNGFTCECLPSFTGKMCEKDLKPSTVEPMATDTQYTHSNLHTFTYSTATLNNPHVSSSFSAHISSKYPVQPSFAINSTLPNVTPSSSQSRIDVPSTEILASTQIPLIYTDISNYATGKSESHILGTESPIPSRLTVWEISSPSSLYFGTVTHSFPLFSSSITHKGPNVKSISNYAGIFSSQDVLPTPVAGITSMFSGNVGARTAASDFVSDSNPFKTSSFRNIPSFSSTTLHNILITSSFDSSHSVKHGAISEYVDSVGRSSSAGIRISKVLISPSEVNPSSTDHTHSNILSILSSSGSLSLLQPTTTTSVPMSKNTFESSVLHKSSKRSLIPSKSSMFAVDSASVFPSFNIISSNIYSEYLHSSTPRISLSSFETTLSVQQNSLSHTLPIIPVSSIQNFTSRVYNTTTFTKAINSPDYTSIFATPTSHNIQPTAVQGATMQTSSSMPMYINTFIYDSSEFLSSTESTTKLDIVPTPTVTAFNGFVQTTVSNIKPYATVKPSITLLENGYSTHGFSSVIDTAIPSFSGIFMTISTTNKQATSYSDSLYNKISFSTDIHTTSGINSNSVVQPETLVTQVDYSSYISPAATSSPSISSRNITTDISPSTSIRASIASSLSNSIATTSSKAAGNITPTISRSISSSSNTAAINIVKTEASSGTINTVIDKTTAWSMTANRSRASTETSSFNEKSTFAFAPTSSRNSENIMQSTLVEQVSPTMIVTHLNTDSNEGISKSWRIALIVIGCALFAIAVVFLAVFISVRQRRKDSRIIRHSPEDIQNYSKEHFSEQPDFHNPTYEVENDSDDDSVKYDMYVVNE